MESNILTPARAAERYGVSKSCIYKLIHYRKVPYHKPTGKNIFFLIEDLDKYFLSNRVEPLNVDTEKEAANYLMNNP